MEDNQKITTDSPKSTKNDLNIAEETRKGTRTRAPVADGSQWHPDLGQNGDLDPGLNGDLGPSLNGDPDPEVTMGICIRVLMGTPNGDMREPDSDPNEDPDPGGVPVPGP